MYFLPLLLSIVFFVLNLNAPADLSYVNKLLLFLEFVSVHLAARGIIFSVLKSVNNNYKNKIYVAFLWFFAICLLYLHVCWTPYLSPNGNGEWGFDPQRYYEYASSIIRGEGINFSINYMGVISVYTFIMGIFGIDPMVPLFVNVILVVLVVSVLAKTLYDRYGSNSVTRYVYLFMFLPEVVFYSCVSSREIFSLALVTLVCNMGLTEDLKKSKNIIKIISLLILTFYIRPHYAFAATAAILLVSFRGKSYAVITVVAVMLIALLFNSGLDTSSGSSEGINEMSESLTSKIEGNDTAEESFTYGENSLAKRLIPRNPIQFVVYGIIRSLLYLIPRSNPFPVLFASFGKPYYLSGFFTWLSSFLFMLSIPSLLFFFKEGQNKDIIFRGYFIYFVFFLFFVGMLNTTFIQERYRLVYDFIWMMTWLLAIQHKRNRKKFLLN